MKIKTKSYYLSKLNLWKNHNLHIMLLWVGLVSVFILFENRISNLISSHIIIGQVEVSSMHFKILYITFNLFLFITFLWLFLKNYRLSKQSNFWILFLNITYLVLKNNTSDNLSFIPILNKLSPFNYFSDIILFIGLLTVILFFRNFFNSFIFLDNTLSKIKKSLSFEEEIETFEYKEDIIIDGSKKIDNELIVDALFSNIVNFKPSKAFVVSINAEWGLGKTTFLNRLKFKLKKDFDKKALTPIVFWFNAWQHQDEKSIINNFFNQLKKELSHYSGNANKSINDYLSELSVIFDNKYSRGIELVSNNLFSKNLTVKDSYDRINNLISKINRKIIVLVDDLDRLNKNEIIEVIRILRNTANFKNTIFICGIDKEYIIKTGELENNFLDKIFNLEINLPPVHSKGLFLYLKELISNSSYLKQNNWGNLINKEFNDLFEPEDDINYSNIIYDDFKSNRRIDINNSNIIYDDFKSNRRIDINNSQLNPSMFFQSKRDVKRFYNRLITSIKILKYLDDVDLYCYLIFNLLIFKYNWIYNYFKENNINYWLKEDKGILHIEDEKYLIKDEDNVNSSIIKLILKHLFPKNSVLYPKRINLKRYLPIYVTNNIFNQSFSFSELNKAIDNLNLKELIESKVLKKDESEYLLNDIKNHLLKEENLHTLQQFEQAIILINEYFKYSINTSDILSFIYLGSHKYPGFYNLMVKKAFNEIDNVFSAFLFKLHLFYTSIPKNSGYKFNKIFNFLNKNKKTPLFKADFVSDKISQLLKNLLSNDPLNKFLFNALNYSEKNLLYFEFKTYSDETKNMIKLYLKKHFKERFILTESGKVIENFQIKFIIAVFSDSEFNIKIVEKAEKLIEEYSSWKKSDLNLEDYSEASLLNFISFLNEESKNSKFNNNDKQSISKLISEITKFYQLKS